MVYGGMVSDLASASGLLWPSGKSHCPHGFGWVACKYQKHIAQHCKTKLLGGVLWLIRNMVVFKNEEHCYYGILSLCRICLHDTVHQVLRKVREKNVMANIRKWSMPSFSYSLSHVRLFATVCTLVHQAFLSMEFPRQEYWSGLQLPSPGHLFNPGIELAPPALTGRIFRKSPSPFSLSFLS